MNYLELKLEQFKTPSYLSKDYFNNNKLVTKIGFLICLNSWLSAVFRRAADSNLREDRVGPPALSVSLQRRPQGPAQEPAPGRLDQTHRQPEERRERRQTAQVVPVARLDGHIREAREGALFAARRIRTLRRRAVVHIVDRKVRQRVC